MMKLLLPLALAAAALTANAQPAVRTYTPSTPAPAMAATATTTSTEFGYCGQIASALAPGGANGVKKSAAMQVNAAIARKYNGAKVTAVLVANGTSKLAVKPTFDVEVFCSTELNGAPIAKASGKMDLSKFGEFVEYKLDTPIDIETGNTFYVGYSFTHSAEGDYPIAIDGIASTWPGGLIGVANSNGEMEWQNFGQAYGMVGIRLRIEGDNLPQNEATLSDLVLDAATLEAGKPVAAGLYVTNEAANEIESVDVTYSFGSGEATTVTATLEEPLAPGQSALAITEFTPAEVGANQQLTATVTKVNGQPNASTGSVSRTATVTVIEEGTGFRRNVVMEEKTGTWCGWCPRGIVGIDKLKSEVTDGTFIPIAVHSSDAMATASYNGINNELSGAPSALIDRNLLSIGVIDPGYETLKAAYLQALGEPAIAEITINSIEEGTRVTKFDVSLTFALTVSNARYRLAFVAIEDQVGPYGQANYYSGTDMPLDGWENLPNPTSVMFNDVARSIKSYTGITSSVPASVEAGTVYNYTKGTVENTGIKKKEHGRYAVLLLNTQTGRIENAATVLSPEAVSIKSVETTVSDDVEVRYFDLQGRRVANPAAGHLYITSDGQKIIF